MQFLRAYRIEVAKRRLLTTQDTIGEIRSGIKARRILRTRSVVTWASHRAVFERLACRIPVILAAELTCSRGATTLEHECECSFETSQVPEGRWHDVVIDSFSDLRMTQITLEQMNDL